MEPPMSRTPASAPPSATTDEAGDTQTQVRRATDGARRAADGAVQAAGRLATLAREHPRTAIAAGATVAAGVAAAAAIPLVKARRSGANGAAAPKAAPARKAPARKRAPARKSTAKKS
jgi:DNA-binding protein HU-beta